MKNIPALLCLVPIACLSLTAQAQDKVPGTSWLAESVNSVEPTDGISLKLEFAKTLNITYTLAGEAQSWQYRYSITDGQLILEPLQSLGQPQTVTYDIKFDEGKLLLLTPKPKPIEEKAEDAQKTKTDADADADADADSQAPAQATTDESSQEAEVVKEAGKAEETKDVEEEDTRTPVWVLVKA